MQFPRRKHPLFPLFFVISSLLMVKDSLRFTILRRFQNSYILFSLSLVYNMNRQGEKFL